MFGCKMRKTSSFLIIHNLTVEEINETEKILLNKTFQFVEM